MTASAAVSQERSTGSRVASAALVAVGLGPWMGLVYVLAFVVPRFSEIFNKFQMTLPPLTRVILDVSQFVRTWGLVGVPLLLLGVAALAIWSARARSGSALWVAGIFAAVSLAVVPVAMALIAVGLFEPLVVLTQKVGGR